MEIILQDVLREIVPLVEPLVALPQPLKVCLWLCLLSFVFLLALAPSPHCVSVVILGALSPYPVRPLSLPVSVSFRPPQSASLRPPVRLWLCPSVSVSFCPPCPPRASFKLFIKLFIHARCASHSAPVGRPVVHPLVIPWCARWSSLGSPDGHSVVRPMVIPWCARWSSHGAPFDRAPRTLPPVGHPELL